MSKISLQTSCLAKTVAKYGLIPIPPTRVPRSLSDAKTKFWISDQTLVLSGNLWTLHVGMQDGQRSWISDQTNKCKFNFIIRWNPCFVRGRQLVGYVFVLLALHFTLWLITHNPSQRELMNPPKSWIPDQTNKYKSNFINRWTPCIVHGRQLVGYVFVLLALHFTLWLITHNPSQRELMNPPGHLGIPTCVPWDRSSVWERN